MGHHITRTGDSFILQQLHSGLLNSWAADLSLQSQFCFWLGLSFFPSATHLWTDQGKGWNAHWLCLSWYPLLRGWGSYLPCSGCRGQILGNVFQFPLLRPHLHFCSLDLFCITCGLFNIPNLQYYSFNSSAFIYISSQSTTFSYLTTNKFQWAVPEELCTKPKFQVKEKILGKGKKSTWRWSNSVFLG